MTDLRHPIKVTKKCKDCEKEKDIEDFHKIYNGKYLRSYCKQCHNVRATAQRKTKKGKEWVNKYQKNKLKSSENEWIKHKCRLRLRKHFYRGNLIKRNSCEICHNGPTNFHHDDYTKPFKYIELCVRCHKKLHQQYKEQGIIIKTV